MMVWIPDLATGLVWLLVAVLTVRGRGSFATLATGVTLSWFAAASFGSLALWHRPLIALLLICGPSWWPRTWSARLAILATAASSVLVWPWTSPLGALLLSVALVAGFQIERRGAPGLWWPACLTAAIAFGAPPLLWTILPPGRSGFISWAYDAALIAVALLAHAQWRTDRSSDPLDLVIDLAPADESTLDAEERLAAIRLDADHERLLRELEAGVEELRASRLRLTEASDRARAHLRSELAEEVITPLGRLMEELGDAPSSPHEASAREHLRIATADIAALALGLAPRAVADGLSAALHELVDATPLPVQILADDVDLPSGVVTTAYYVCAEALANIERHAEASHAVVTVRALADVLLVRVEDDGVGGADAALGTGIRGLRDRLAAYEGRLEINSSPAGTRVEAILPLRALGPVPEPATAVTEAAP